jgi:hypothetical protein
MVHCTKLPIAIEIFDAVDFVTEQNRTDEALKEVIHKVFLHGNQRIVENSFQHSLVHFCLQTLLNSRYTVPEEDKSFQDIMSWLVYDGNTELLKDFVAIGCQLPPVIGEYMTASRKPIEVLKLYISCSLEAATSSNVRALVQSSEFKPTDFEAMIKEGSLNFNACMDAAMSEGRLDLAYVGYMNGLRLPYGMEPDSHFQEHLYANTPTEMAKYIAMKESFRLTNSLLQSVKNQDSSLRHVPKETLMYHIGMMLNSVTAKSIRQDLFEKDTTDGSIPKHSNANFNASDFTKKW